MAEVTLVEQAELALANAKRLQRDARSVVGDIARIRDALIIQDNTNVQSRRDTTNGHSTDRHSNP